MSYNVGRTPATSSKIGVRVRYKMGKTTGHCTDKGEIPASVASKKGLSFMSNPIKAETHIVSLHNPSYHSFVIAGYGSNTHRFSKKSFFLLNQLFLTNK